jgi:rhodanese-related sulfurtransferase
MGIKNKPSEKTKKIQFQVIIIILIVIALGISAAIFLPRLLDDSGETTTTLAKNKRISVDEAYQLYQDDVYVLDVRTPEEWVTGHIPGATLIPLDELALRSGELPVGEPILIYCRSGNRSLEAMNLLGSAGFMNLSSMDGGIKDWIIAGYPLE